jgi:hypothetical protein
MSWVLIYIATNFLAPIPLISPEIDDFFLSIFAQVEELPTKWKSGMTAPVNNTSRAAGHNL